MGVKLKYGTCLKAIFQSFIHRSSIGCRYSLGISLFSDLRCFWCRWLDYTPRKNASSETGQSEFPCRRWLPAPWRFPQHDGLLLELRNKKSSFALFWAKALFNNRCYLLIVSHNTARMTILILFDTRGIRATRKISLRVQCGLVQAWIMGKHYTGPSICPQPSGYC